MTEQQGSGDTKHAGRQAGGPGRLVRDARLRRDMTVEQVAEALHLDRRTVEQLEGDDFDALPPLTFVRGYLRAYCHLLDLDPAPVIDRLAEAGVTDTESPLKAHAGAEAGNARAPKPVSRGPGFLVLALGLALLIAGVVAIAWWLSRSELPIPLIGATDEQAETTFVERADPTAAAGDEPAVGEGADTAAGATAPSGAPPVLVDETPERASVPTPQATPALETPETAETSDSPMAASPDSGASTDSAEAEAPPTTSVSDAEPSPDSPAQAPDGAAGPDELVFRFSGDSWMEVTDDSGERLLFGMAQPGEERLSGKAPFDIVIGNTRNVTLEYRDEAVDLEAYARGNVARFTLGGS